MGPKQETVGAFWRMISENKVQAVLMVTGLLEKGTEKCFRYWPAELGSGDGNFNIISDRFSRRFQLYPTPHAPHDVSTKCVCWSGAASGC